MLENDNNSTTVFSHLFGVLVLGVMSEPKASLPFCCRPHYLFLAIYGSLLTLPACLPCLLPYKAL
jgi:hypothetical protein